MIIWHSLTNEEKLFIWRNLRNNIENKDIEFQLEQIAEFFFSVPFGSRSIDYYSPRNWPTPWEILFYGEFCKSSISLLIFYTLTLVNKDAKIVLLLIDDKDDVYLLPFIDNKFVLNFELGQISSYSEVQKDFRIIKVYSKDEIRVIK